MASLGHVAVGLAAARACGGARERLARRMLACGVLSMLPDADVLAFRFGIPYGAPFGHRGATHSIVFAVAVAILGAVLGWRQRPGSPDRRRRALAIFACVLFVVGSHGPLDMLTDGGKGVALFWPFSTARLFFPWRPIPVAPIGVRVLSARGLYVMGFELVAFAPFWLYAFFARRRGRSSAPA